MIVFSKKYISAINISLLIFYVALAVVLPFLHTCGTNDTDEPGAIHPAAACISNILTYAHDSISEIKSNTSHHGACAACLLAGNCVSLLQVTNSIINNSIQFSSVVSSEIAAKYQHILLLSSRAPPVSW